MSAIRIIPPTDESPFPYDDAKRLLDALRWSDRAKRDLDAIARYISTRDNRLAARRWIGQLRTRARAAARNPLGRPQGPGVRP